MNLVEYGKPYRFKKGEPSPNKGKRQCEFMSASAIEKTKPTRFKKGQTPHNHRPVGSEKINPRGFIEIKIKEGLHGWKLKHIVVWEAKNGSLPKGFAVQFKDGDKTNCNIDNLYIVHKGEIASKNSMNNYPANLQKLLRLKGSLKREIKKQKNYVKEM